jgi:hypothetical protein
MVQDAGKYLTFKADLILGVEFTTLLGSLYRDRQCCNGPPMNASSCPAANLNSVRYGLYSAAGHFRERSHNFARPSSSAAKPKFFSSGEIANEGQICKA